jgi:ribosomal-protein-serine acetyltransferase
VRRIELTDDCHMRPLAEDDAPRLQELIERNRDRLASWFDWAAGQDLAETQAFLRGAEQEADRGETFQAGVVRDGEIVGLAGFVAVDRRLGLTRIGYWLDREHEGRGTMTAAVRALVDLAFGEWGLNRVEIRAAAGNRRSRAIPERLGFRQEGVLRQAERVGGRLLDSVVYAMLAEDWPMREPQSSPR